MKTSLKTLAVPPSSAPWSEINILPYRALCRTLMWYRYVQVLLALAHTLHQAVADLKVLIPPIPLNVFMFFLFCFSLTGQVKRAPKALAALCTYAMQRSRALNLKLSITKSEVASFFAQFSIGNS